MATSREVIHESAAEPLPRIGARAGVEVQAGRQHMSRTQGAQQSLANLRDDLYRVIPSTPPGTGWLAGLARLLSCASDTRVPLLERARLLAVFSLHLDDFFMIGIAHRTEAAAAGPEPHGLLHDVLDALAGAHDRLLHDDVLPALAAEGMSFPVWDELNDREEAKLRQRFRDIIHPLVTPLVVDATHPFPYVSSLSLNLGVVLRDRDSAAERFACVRVPTVLPRFLRLDARRMVGIESIVSASLGELFQGMQLVEVSSFRVTRHEEFTSGDNGVGEGRPVRLEVDHGTSAGVVEILARNLGLSEDEVYRARAPLGMAATILAITDDSATGASSPTGASGPTGVTADPTGAANATAAVTADPTGAANPPLRIARPPRVTRLPRAASSTARPRARRRLRPPPAVLPSHAPSARAFLEQATADPAVLVIAQTLSYHSADPTVVDALIDAVAAGKQVLVVIEGRGPDRDRSPSTLSRRLTRGGCLVGYGLTRVRGACALGFAVGEAGAAGVCFSAHIGTPGYYPWGEGDPCDAGLISTDPDVCADVARLVLCLSGTTAPDGSVAELSPSFAHGPATRAALQ